LVVGAGCVGLIPRATKILLRTRRAFRGEPAPKPETLPSTRKEFSERRTSQGEPPTGRSSTMGKPPWVWVFLGGGGRRLHNSGIWKKKDRKDAESLKGKRSGGGKRRCTRGGRGVFVEKKKKGLNQVLVPKSLLGGKKER